MLEVAGGGEFVIRFVVCALAAWRLTHLVVAEDGPGDLMAKLRRRAGAGFWGRLMDCFYCTSAWIAAPLALVVAGSYGELLLVWPALSGAACLLERVTAPPVLMQRGDPESARD